jgi:hypothetical protein
MKWNVKLQMPVNIYLNVCNIITTTLLNSHEICRFELAYNSFLVSKK